MLVIGLTGGMGAGKSTVARVLSDLGAHVIDADQVAREVVQPGTPGLAAIVEEFGEEVLDDDGTLDRPAMASIVFADDDRLAALEAITHPAIREQIEQRLDGHAAAERDEQQQRVVVLDHPLLVESGMADSLELVVVVTAPEELRVRRLVEGRGVDPEDARSRMRQQTDDATRVAAASHVVRNDADEAVLRERVEALWQALPR